MNLTEPEMLQREYYERTASGYEQAHVGMDDEHAIALAFFEGFAARTDHASILDVGAGTGRGVSRLKSSFGGSRVVGIEPVAALRKVGHDQGLSASELQEGDATQLRFGDDSFDWAIETGVLHHIRDWQKAVTEMCRVAKRGVLISDSNNIGQGGRMSSHVKAALRALGLWKAFIAIQTRGKMYKYSDGDGIYFSFCAFDCVPLLRRKFSHVHFINTGVADADLLRTAGHVAIIAWR